MKEGNMKKRGDGRGAVIRFTPTPSAAAAVSTVSGGYYQMSSAIDLQQPSPQHRQRNLFQPDTHVSTNYQKITSPTWTSKATWNTVEGGHQPLEAVDNETETDASVADRQQQEA
jgi:hypothetical protein